MVVDGGLAVELDGDALAHAPDREIIELGVLGRLGDDALGRQLEPVAGVDLAIKSSPERLAQIGLWAGHRKARAVDDPAAKLNAAVALAVLDLDR